MNTAEITQLRSQLNQAKDQLKEMRDTPSKEITRATKTIFLLASISSCLLAALSVTMMVLIFIPGVVSAENRMYEIGLLLVPSLAVLIVTFLARNSLYVLLTVVHMGVFIEGMAVGALYDNMTTIVGNNN